MGWDMVWRVRILQKKTGQIFWPARRRVFSRKDGPLGGVLLLASWL
jgi:hypothetical protein